MPADAGFGREYEEMKEKLTKNGSLKLISLFCAFFVWLAVVNVANPTKVSTEEVKVEFINGQVLEASNLTYEIVGKSTATISFKVRTKDEYKITASDFRAYADLSEMYDVTGAIPIKVEVLNNAELLESTPVVKSPEVVKIQTEELQTKAFAVQPMPDGRPSEGYQPGQITVSPAQVAVKGPVSQIGRISTVGIEFNADGATADITGTATPKYFDANGNELLLSESVTTIGGDVSYTMQVLKVKTLPLDFIVTGEVAEGYRYTGAEAVISSVDVAGLKSDLASISTVSVQDPSLNIDGATQDMVCQIDLKSYIDPSLTIVGMDETVIQVTLKVEQLREKDFQAEVKDITLTGKDDAYNYTIGRGRIEVTIRGLKEDLDSLSVDKMNIQADVSGLEKGTHTIQAQLDLDDAFEVVTYPELRVTVTDRTAEELAELEETGEGTDGKTTEETDGELQNDSDQ